MSLKERDVEMLSVSVPVVDYWEMRDDLDRLEDSVNRLEKVIETLVELYRIERVKTWEMVLAKMVEKEEKKGNRSESTVRRR